VAGCLLFILPGWALLAWLLPGWRKLSWGERAGLAGGTSLALSPLAWLWGDTLGLRLGALFAWGPAALGAVALIAWIWRRKRKAASQPSPVTSRQSSASNRRVSPSEPAPIFPSSVLPVFRSSSLPYLGWWLVFALLVVTRLWPARGLETPMWGDGYHHTLIAQLLVENGGLFRSWAPYAELQTFTYHFGFHTLAAGFHWLTGAPTPQATLWTGQLVNLLAVLALYPLAVRLGGNRWAGVGAVLVAGLLAPLPQVYLNWSRYTQLAGQAILPAAVWLAWEALARMEGKRSLHTIRNLQFAICILLAALVFAGLALTHYRVAIFALLFFPAWMALEVRRRHFRAWFSRALAIGLAAFLLFLPWFLRLYGGLLMQAFTRQASTPAAQTSASVETYNTLGSLSAYLPWPVWAMLGLAVMVSLWRRERTALVVIVWWIVVVLAANPGWLGLPGAGILSNFAVFIGMYIPAAVLVGAAFGWGMEKVRSERFNVLEQAQERTEWRTQRVAHKNASTTNLVFFLLVLLAVLGAWRRIEDIQPGVYALVTPPDSRAAAWIKTNLPQDARFLVNSFFAYSGSLVVGSDAGWWLPLLAERQSTLPPITYSSEQGPRPDYLTWTNQLVALARDLGPGHPQTLAELRARRVTHVFIGQRQGQVGGPALLDPEQLRADPHFHPVYHQDKVWIFEIRY
jgi:hypothetical protein